MYLAALYDIHGNLPALEAVLEEVRRKGAEQVVIGGDVVPGPMPREALDLLLGTGRPTRFILGNGDREVLARLEGRETEWYRAAAEAWREPVRWSAEQLGPQHGRALASWEATCRMEVPGLGEVLFCHGTPRSDTEIFTRRTPEETLQPLFAEVGAAVVVCGHTHLQLDRRIGRTRVVNAGSVGMPCGQPGAGWLALGPGVELRWTRYDLEAAAARIRATRYPQADSFADRCVLQPPSEEEALEVLSRAELR